MLDQLINLVRDNSSDDIIRNPAIPNEKNEEAISATAGSILEGLKGQLTAGNLESLGSLFKGGNLGGNSTISALSEMAGSNLASKLGIDAAVAGQIASGLVPKVLEQFASKTNDPSDSSFTLDGIAGALAGNDKAGDLLGKLKNFI